MLLYELRVAGIVAGRVQPAWPYSSWGDRDRIWRSEGNAGEKVLSSDLGAKDHLPTAVAFRPPNPTTTTSLSDNHSGHALPATSPSLSHSPFLLDFLRGRMVSITDQELRAQPDELVSSLLSKVKGTDRDVLLDSALGGVTSCDSELLH